MVNILSVSRSHLNSCGESYFRHLLFASRTGATMIVAGLACVAHGILPGLFETTGSRTIKSLATRFTHRGAPPPKSAYRAWL
jgi:Family of unknown function (DUF6356)